MRIVALIPARAGSKRVPGKNMRRLYGKPLIHWTIEAAKESGVFADIAVCTDDYGIVEWLFENSSVRAISRSTASDDQPDIVWVREVLAGPALTGFDAFAILRPTSPFRTADTIRRAVAQFTTAKCSSLRAVERAKQHPFKMWRLNKNGWADPLFPTGLHSQPTQSLPEVYVQNSSLEIAWTWCVTTFDTISGPKVAPFFTEGMEGFAIDYPDDWERAERYVAHLQAQAAAE